MNARGSSFTSSPALATRNKEGIFAAAENQVFCLAENHHAWADFLEVHVFRGDRWPQSIYGGQMLLVGVGGFNE